MTEVLILALVVIAAFVFGVIFAVKHHAQILAKQDQLAQDYRDMAQKAHDERDAIFARFAPSHPVQVLPAAAPAPAASVPPAQ